MIRTLAYGIGSYIVGLAFLPHVALAHSELSVPVTPEALWYAWNLDPWLLGCLLLTHWLYGRGVSRLWGRAGLGRGISAVRVAAFAAGELVLVVALISPLDALGETLLAAHMVQHGLLIVVAPPLLVLGLPGAAFAWMLPAATRRGLSRSSLARTVARSFSWMLNPLVAAAIHGAVVWLWHVPAIFDAALSHRGLHTFEHFSFLATALLFWHSLMLATRTVSTAALGVAAAFVTLLHGGFLGALITFAPQVLFEWYVGRTSSWGLDPLEDQQLAGLIMWVPLGIIYFLAGLVLAAGLVPTSSGYPAPGRSKLIPPRDLRNRAIPRGFARQ